MDASSQCNYLTVFSSSQVIPGNWLIKVTQFSCSFANLAPAGCTQYFFGDDSGSVKSFNYDGGQHLAEQNQVFCVRREVGTCGICWSAIEAIDFMVSGSGMMGITSENVSKIRLSQIESIAPDQSGQKIKSYLYIIS